MSYSIKEVADMMNVNPSTLRYYDSLELLPKIKELMAEEFLNIKNDIMKQPSKQYLKK